MAAWGVAAESKLRSFVHFAVDKLEAAKPSFEDAEEVEGENFSELCAFAVGMSRNLKNTGSKATADLKAAIAAALEPVWDIKTDQPGEKLKEGMVPALLEALNGMVAEGGCLYAAPQPEPEPASTEAPTEEAEAAREARMLRIAQNPAGIRDMTLEAAINHMWDVLDKEQHMHWGEGGFAFDIANRGSRGRDTCKNPLFSYMNEEHPFWQKATTKTFIALLDNYEREVGKVEKVTREEKKEMDDFMDALMATPVMKFAFNWLRHHGTDQRCKKHFATMHDFQNVVYDCWFTPYRRVTNNDSSGFEHVMVGEEKDGKITGLHNWIQYYVEEKKGNIDYLGWVGKQDQNNGDDVNLVSVAFAWADDDPETEIKPMSTMLVGCSVEWEMAALTMAFLGGAAENSGPKGSAENRFHLQGEQMMIKCYHKHVRVGGTKIASAYIEVV